MLRRILLALPLVISLCTGYEEARAEGGFPTAAAAAFVPDTFSNNLNAIVRHPTESRVFVSDGANNRIVVIDQLTTDVSFIELPGSPHWLAVTKDGAKLGAAIDTAGFVLINLTTNAVESQVLFNKEIVTFDFDFAGNIYFSTNETFGKIWKGDPLTGIGAESFGTQSTGSFFSEGLVRSDASGNNVYVSDGPGRLTRTTVSSGAPLNVITSSEGSTGINDFRVSPDGAKLYVASTIPSGVVVYKASDLTLGISYDTDTAPVAIDLKSDGSKLFVLTDPVLDVPDLFVYSTGTTSLLESIITARRPGIFFSGPLDAGMVTTLDGTRQFYLEGYDGSLDLAQKGWVVGVTGDDFVPPAPVVQSATFTPKSFGPKGGKVTVTAAIVNAENLETIQIVARLGSKKVRGTMTAGATTDGVTTYTGEVKIPKLAKTLTAATYSLSLQGTSTSGEIVISVLGKVKVKAKKKRS